MSSSATKKITDIIRLYLLWQWQESPNKVSSVCNAICCQSQLAEEQREQVLLLNIGFLNLRCYFGKAVCTGLFRTDFLLGFLHGFSARIFARISCTDFLHGFFARIFCTDFFCTVFCPIFLRGFLHGFFARIVCTDVARIFARMFRGCPKHLLGSAKISPRKSPGKFTMLWGPSGEGLGRQEGEVRLWPAWPGQSLPGLGGWGGADGESCHSGELGPKFLKARSKYAKPRSAERGRPEGTMNWDPELCSKFFTRKISPKIPSAPWAQ